MNTIDALLQELAHARTYARSKEVQQFALDLAGKYEGPLLSMCSKEGPSEAEIDQTLFVVQEVLPYALGHDGAKWDDQVRSVIEMVYALRHRIGRDPLACVPPAPSPKVADASLQGEGSSLDLGDAVQSDGPGSPLQSFAADGERISAAIPIAPPHKLTFSESPLDDLDLFEMAKVIADHRWERSPQFDQCRDEALTALRAILLPPDAPPIAEHPQGQPSENPDAR